MTGKQITIVAIDDDPDDIELLRGHLEGVREWDAVLVAFTYIESARGELARRTADIAIIDYLLGAETGLDVLNALRASGDDIPVIILTGRGDEHIAVEAMKAGASDYITKERMDSESLSRSIRYAIHRHKMEAAMEQARRLENHLAFHDGLTGLPNRKLLLDRLHQALARARRQGCHVAVLFLDLDRFKSVNDNLGHAMGDLLLDAVADRLTRCIRQADTAARLGGDEFVIVLGEIEQQHGPATVAQKILTDVAKPFSLDGHELLVTASVGISLSPHDGDAPETLIQNADAAMYRAKEQGGSRYQFYLPAMNARALERMRLEKDLRRAIERQELQAYYQPQTDMRTGQITGFEALLRWRHHDLGLLPARDFIPLAEETGLIVPIGEWILHAACAQSEAWRDAGGANGRMSVNLSARQFRHGDLTATVAWALREACLGPDCLALEITESSAMHDADHILATLHEVKRMGVQLAIDDFGTGYSSLSYLRRFPLDILKIDQSFVRNITASPDGVAITRAIIDMAHSLQLKAIAEGVETVEQQELLQSLGCDEQQGYLFSRPLPADEATRLLAERIAPA